MCKESEAPNWPSTSGFQLPWCHNPAAPNPSPLEPHNLRQVDQGGQGWAWGSEPVPWPTGVPSPVIKASTSAVILTWVSAGQNTVRRKVDVTRTTFSAWFLFSLVLLLLSLHSYGIAIPLMIMIPNSPSKHTYLFFKEDFKKFMK